jgi:hypothetical protein
LLAFAAARRRPPANRPQEYSSPPRLLDEVMCMVSKEVSISHGWASTTQGRVLHTGVGPTNAMQSVSCGDQCAWEADEANLAMWDTHFTTDIANLGPWMDDVRALLDKDFWKPSEERRGRCLPPGYFWLRFGSGSGDYINPTSGLNGTVNLQMSFMTSKATAPRWGIKHGHILETLEQLTLCKCAAAAGAGAGGLLAWCWQGGQGLGEDCDVTGSQAASGASQRGSRGDTHGRRRPPPTPALPARPPPLPRAGTRGGRTGARTTTAPSHTPAAP